MDTQGGYWYLDTRPEEYESIGAEWARLKAAARALDWRVKGGGSGRFRTLLHGDFKAANILHSQDGARWALRWAPLRALRGGVPSPLGRMIYECVTLSPGDWHLKA